jgi:protein-S-isoprenylcysteine O-methyltransferase Ste14
MLLFLLLVFRAAMQANLLPHPHLPNRIWVLLVLLVAWFLYWTVRMMRTFRLPD